MVRGSVSIPLGDIIDFLSGKPIKNSWEYILLELRMPRAITAIFVGAGISVTGLQMQTLFRNPLADTSILGIGHGASLGVGSFVMLSTLFPAIFPTFIANNYWGLILSAIIGAFVVLLCVFSVASWLKDMISVLIVGVMVGFITSSIVSIMQYFSDPEVIKSYLIWTFGSLSGTTWTQLYVMIPIVAIGLILSFLMPKYMNALLLGENYAQSVGVKVLRVRIMLVLLTSLITGTLTAFVGPIVFLGIAVPHCARLLFKTTNHRILIPATMLCGTTLMLACDIITQLPPDGIVLPINAVTSVLGAPIVIFIILRNRRTKSIFN